MATARTQQRRAECHRRRTAEAARRRRCEGRASVSLLTYLVGYERDRARYWSDHHPTYQSYIQHHGFCTWELYEGFRAAYDVMPEEDIAMVGDARAVATLFHRPMSEEDRQEVLHLARQRRRAGFPMNYQHIVNFMRQVCPLPARPHRMSYEELEEDRDAWRSLAESRLARIVELEQALAEATHQREAKP